MTTLTQTLTTNVVRIGQVVSYTELATFTEFKEDEKRVWKIKIRIKSDSYDFQSSARCSLWDGFRWNPLVNLEWGEMKTPSCLCYKRTVEMATDVKHFIDDRNELLRRAEMVLL